jgi:predicted amidohydrolase YtcJ
VMGAHERLDAVEAFRCHTEHAAATLGLGERIGHLRVGADADLVVVDTDPFEADSDALRGTWVLRHFRAGDEVWERLPEG